MGRRALGLFLAALVWFGGAATAGAEKGGAKFKKRVAVALKHYQEGAYRRSLDELQAAYALRPAPRLLCNMAQANEKLGELGPARELFERCLRDDDKLRGAARERIEERVAALRERRQLSERGPELPIDPDYEPPPAPLSAETIVAGPLPPSVSPLAAPVPALPLLPLVRMFQRRARTAADEGAVQPRNTWYLLGLAATGPDELWAVGSGGRITRYHGGSWELVESGTALDLNAIWAGGPRDIVVVGEGGTILRLAPSGDRFVPEVSGTTRPLFGIAGSGPRDLWAVGEGGTALHFDGKAWTAAATGTDSLLLSVCVPERDSVFAVGAKGTILRRTGGRFVVMDSGTDKSLYAVNGLSNTTLWAAGEQGVVLRWDGVRWLPQELPTRTVLFGIAASGSGTWIVGSSGVVIGWDGIRWTRYDSRVGADLRAVLLGSSLWAVGLNGLILQYQPP